MTKKEKCSVTQKDRIVIHKGDVELRIYENEREAYLKLGWLDDISDKHRENLRKSHKGKKTWNTGTKGISKKNSGSFKKGNKPWNKDKKVPYKSEKTLEIKLSKEYITKKANNSFNTSKPENELYKQLLNENKNKTIYRNYKCDRYPFYCDFYIVDDDLFIELNAHWTHGGRPFDSEDQECINKLDEWKEKAKTSKFYENAIITWTQRDVKKRKVAEENSLNYKVIY